MADALKDLDGLEAFLLVQSSLVEQQHFDLRGLGIERIVDRVLARIVVVDDFLKRADAAVAFDDHVLRGRALPGADDDAIRLKVAVLADVIDQEIDLELALEELRLETTLDLVLVEARFRDDRRALLDVHEPRIERIEDQVGDADSDGRQLGI